MSKMSEVKVRLSGMICLRVIRRDSAEMRVFTDNYLIW